MGSRNIRKTHELHLSDPEIAAEYLNEALLSNDPAVILISIRNVVDAQDGGMTKVSQKTKLGRESMYKMLSPKGNPKLATFSALLQGLGLQLQVVPSK